MESLDRAIESALTRLHNAEANLATSTGSKDIKEKKKRQVEICKITLEALQEKQEWEEHDSMIENFMKDLPELRQKVGGGR